MMLKRLLVKKEQGAIDDILAMAISLVLIMMVFLGIMNYLSLLEINKTFDGYIRESLLEFESADKTANIANMEKKLEDRVKALGFTNVHAKFLPNGGATHGKEISVTLTVKMKKEELKLFNVYGTQKDYTYEATKYSTSKAIKAY